MNRMIALFQRKADVAMHEYCQHREATIKFPVNSEEWTAALTKGARLAATYTVWQKAADLLRKEELQR